MITFPSGSVSLLMTLLLNGISTNELNVSSVAIGGVLPDGSSRSRTSIDTVAVSVLPFSSAIIYSKVSSPLKPAAGVYS